MAKKEIDYGKISIEADGDLIFVTVAKYKMFLQGGKAGVDAYMLYSHYQFTARLQNTNSVKANGKYVKNGLGWGEDRFRKAKKFLIEKQLVKNIVRRDKNNIITGHYIEVRTTTSPEGMSTTPETHVMDQQQDGKQETNALTNNLNTLTKKEKPGDKSPITVKDTDKHQQIIKYFNDTFIQLYPGEKISFDKKEIGCVVNLKKHPLEEIYKKGDILKKRCRDKKLNANGYFTFIPSVMLSKWNNLTHKASMYD